jgi:hypothetical protein
VPAQPVSPVLPPQTQPVPSVPTGLPPEPGASGARPLPGVPMPGSPVTGTPVPGMTLPPAAPYPYGRPPRSGRGAAPWLIVGGAVLAVVLGIVAFVVLTGEDPELTYRGDEITEPERTLTAAESTLRDIVEERHGASDDDTRCYFAIPANAERDTDVSEQLRCGPVLFVDGDAGKPYLTFALEPQDGEDGLRLVAADQPESDEPESLPQNETLKRPDGQGPPSGSGDLEPPPPPRADPGLLESQHLDEVELDRPEGPARIGSWSTSLTLDGLAQPDRIGRGDDARRPAEGEMFIAANLTPGAGEEVGAREAEALIQIGDEDPVPAPGDLATAGGGLLISAPEDAERVDLILNDHGVEQRMSLLDGSTGDHNLAVLRRENRHTSLNGHGSMTFTGSLPGYVPQNFTIGVNVTEAGLFWWAGQDNSRHPESSALAYLVVAVDVDWPAELGGPAEDSILDPPAYTLIPRGGNSIAVTNLSINPADTIIVGFQVPADFTEGTFRIGGRHTAHDGVTIDFGTAVFDVPISIPAG